MEIKIKDPSEDIGFVTKEDPWLVLSNIYGEEFKNYRERWELASNFELEGEFPIQLDFELNNTCNLKCVGCTFSIEKVEKAEKFPIDKFKEIIVEGYKKGLRAVNLNFVNEPLIRKDIVDFIKIAKDNGILDISFNSNATLLTEELTEKLLDSGLTRIQFSIDAFSEESYNQIRIGGIYSKVIQNIEYFLKRKEEKQLKVPLVAVSMIKMSSNESEIEPFANYWKEKVDFVILREYLSPYGTDSEHFDEKEKYFMNNHHTTKNFRCNKPWQRMVIRTDGTALPCCTFFAPQLPMGNINSNTISELWNSNNMKSLRKMHKEGRYKENKVCRECAKCSTGD